MPLAACAAEDTSPETREVEAAEEDLRWVVAVAREQRTLDETRTRAAAADAAAKHGRDTRPKLPDIDETRNTARRGVEGGHGKPSVLHSDNYWSLFCLAEDI